MTANYIRTTAYIESWRQMAVEFLARLYLGDSFKLAQRDAGRVSGWSPGREPSTEPRDWVGAYRCVLCLLESVGKDSISHTTGGR